MKRNTILGITILTLLVVSAAVFTKAQSALGGSGTVFSGRVVDPAGAGIDDALISLKGIDKESSTRSKANGEFSMVVPDGSYDLLIERTAFKKVFIPNFVIASGKPAATEFAMKVDCCIDYANIVPVSAPAVSNPAAPEPDIGVNGFYSSDKVQRGRTVRVAVVIDIPGGYHVNGNKPLGKYAIPTTLKLESPKGVTVGPIAYPPAKVRALKAVNNERLAFYDGRAIIRFNLTVPAGYSDGWLNLKAHLRYQSCNDEVCFPPKNHDFDLGIGVVGPNESVKRANGQYFGR